MTGIVPCVYILWTRPASIHSWNWRSISSICSCGTWYRCRLATDPSNEDLFFTKQGWEQRPKNHLVFVDELTETRVPLVVIMGMNFSNEASIETNRFHRFQ